MNSRDKILNAALELSHESHYLHIRRDDIATRAGVTNGTVHYHFGTIPKLRRAIIRYAINQDDLCVIAQGLSSNDKHAKKAPQDVKDRAAKYIASRS